MSVCIQGIFIEFYSSGYCGVRPGVFSPRANENGSGARFIGYCLRQNKMALHVITLRPSRFRRVYVLL